jgi:hypothetical protein
LQPPAFINDCSPRRAGSPVAWNGSGRKPCWLPWASQRSRSSSSPS